MTTKETSMQEANGHHLLVEIIQHVTSPLTSSLCIFGVYKASHIPKMKAWWRAISIIKKSNAARSKASSTAQSPFRLAASSSSPASSHPHSHSHSHSHPHSHPYPHPHSSASPMFGAPSQSRAFSSRATSLPLSSLSSLSSLSPLSSLSSLSPSSSLPSSRSLHPLKSSIRTFSSSSPSLFSSPPPPSSPFFLSSVSSEVPHLLPLSWYTESPLTGADVFLASAKLQELLNLVHLDFGLPWWQSIVCLTLCLRFLVLPLNVSLVRNTLRLHSIKPNITALNDKMSNPNSSPAEKEEAARSLVSLLKEKRCHPLKNVASPFLFPPLFLSLFGGVLDFSVNHPEAVGGGTLWFPDLSAHDPSFILPVISAVTWLATIEMASGEYFPLKPWILSATRLGAIAMIPVTLTLPSGIFMFWITSNLFACVRALVVRQPPVARALGIPVLPKKVA